MIKNFWRKFKVALFTFLILHLFRHLMHAVIRTCKVEVSGLDLFQKIVREDKCILMLWHNRLVPMEFFLKRYAPRERTYGAVISNSRDGELLARLVKSYPQGRAIRIHHRAKHRGLLEMIEHLNVHGTVILITPDGPQGPCYEVKPGVVLAAQATGAKILPLSWTGSHFWELKSWDRMRFPKPFSTIELKFGAPILLAKEEKSDYSLHTKKLKQVLMDLS